MVLLFVCFFLSKEQGAENLIYYFVETLENNDCENRVDPADLNLLSQNTLCAVHDPHNSFISLGGAAGPLVADEKLIGIGSWSASIHNGKSDQFIRVSVFFSWVLENSNITATCEKI